jgi:hypothetical protein
VLTLSGRVVSVEVTGGEKIEARKGSRSLDVWTRRYSIARWIPPSVGSSGGETESDGSGVSQSVGQCCACGPHRLRMSYDDVGC